MKTIRDTIATALEALNTAGLARPNEDFIRVKHERDVCGNPENNRSFWFPSVPRHADTEIAYQNASADNKHRIELHLRIAGEGPDNDAANDRIDVEGRLVQKTINQDVTFASSDISLVQVDAWDVKWGESGLDRIVMFSIETQTEEA